MTNEETNLVAKTTQKLIALHGERGEKKVGNYTLKQFNPYLDSFENLYIALFYMLKQYNLNVEDYSSEISAIFEYCEDAEAMDMDAISKHIMAIANANALKNKYAQIVATFFAKIKELISKPGYEISKLRDVFAKELGVTFNNSNIFRC